MTDTQNYIQENLDLRAYFDDGRGEPGRYGIPFCFVDKRRTTFVALDVPLTP